MAGGWAMDWQVVGCKMINSWRISGNWLQSILIFWCLMSLTTSQSQPTRTAMIAGQCFQRPGIPKISFNCESGSIIKILRAFHGLRASNREDAARPEQQQEQQQRSLATCRNPESKDASCSFCEGDCIDESVNEVYDWSSCIGFDSCVRTVMQSYMHSCPGVDKFSQYLQVEYQCTPRKTLVNICEPLNRQSSADGWEISSPGYPGIYPPDLECTCSIRAAGDPQTKLFLTFYDLFLETKDGRCKADWLMVQQGEEKHRHCGVITGGVKNISLSSNSISLQFHSDSAEDNLSNPSKPQLQAPQSFKGFWLKIAADNQAELALSCEQVVARAETETAELVSPVGSYARVTTTMSSIDEPVTTEPRNDGSGSEDTRSSDDSTPPRLSNEIFQRGNDNDDALQPQRSPPPRTQFTQRQGHSLDEDESHNLHEEIREAKEDDDPVDDGRKLKESSIFRADSLEVEDSPNISKNSATSASLKNLSWQLSSIFIILVICHS